VEGFPFGAAFFGRAVVFVRHGDGSFVFSVKLSTGTGDTYYEETVFPLNGTIIATAYMGDPFVPVTDITGVPTETTVGILIEPAMANVIRMEYEPVCDAFMMQAL